MSSSSTASKVWRAIDIDSHLIEPEGMWAEYLPSKFKAMAPRTAVDSLGRRRTIIADITLPVIPASINKNWSARLRTRSNVPENAGSDPAVRLGVMDSEGVEIMVMYPTTGLLLASIEDKKVAVALCRAYNNWASDFCSAAPRRLIAHALLPQRWVDATRREIERTIGALGMGGVFMRPNPVGRTLEDPAWASVWSQIEECGVPLGFHEGTSLNIDQFGTERSDNFMFQHVMSHPYEHMYAMLAMIGGGILERHPSLKVSFVEAGCGWVPYWLERLEHHVDEYEVEVPLSLRPTEYFHRQCLVSTDSDEGSVLPAVVSCMGANNFAWSTDFPHPDHEWKGMVGQTMDREDLDDDDKVKIIGGNAARFYGV